MGGWVWVGGWVGVGVYLCEFVSHELLFLLVFVHKFVCVCVCVCRVCVYPNINRML